MPPRVTIASTGDMDTEGHMPRVSKGSLPPRAHAGRTESAGRALRPLVCGVLIALANVALLATEVLAGRKGP